MRHLDAGVLEGQHRGRPHQFNVEDVRADFPILRRKIRGNRLVYLDNAASSQKPRQVIEALTDYYQTSNANVHRGVHTLSQEATDLYEGAREKVRAFIKAEKVEEIVFVRSTTEAVNMVAQSYVKSLLEAGDEVALTGLEHHSNIVPWQLICEERSARLAVAPINDKGEVDLQELAVILKRKPRILAIAHASNALGTLNPVKEIVRMAREEGVGVLIDGAQGAPHVAIDVQDIGCDFYCFSGHKTFGPTGIGILYGRLDVLEQLSPYQGGGEMILSVTFEESTYNHLPFRLEAGTPNIAGAVGLGAAVDYLSRLGLPAIGAYEDDLLEYATGQVESIEGVRIIGTADSKVGVVSFTMENVHPHDIGTILDQRGIAVRTGHHCAQPVMAHFHVPATARASFAFYNTREEIDVLCAGLQEVSRVFR